MNKKTTPNASDGHLLQVHKVSKSFHGKGVVHEVSIELRQREIVGLLGRNGAGKTTTFRMIVGLVRHEGGKIELDGCDISSLPMYRRARMGIGYLSQEPSIFRGLSVEQNIMAVLEYQNLSRSARRERLEGVMKRIGIAPLARQVASTLSGGEKRRLEIARALATNPHFMLLDEPFSGVDPIAVSEIQSLIHELRDMGLGILITDHSVRETLEVTDRSYIIHEGHVIKAGTPEEIVRDREVRQLYLGEQFYMRGFSGYHHDD